MFNRNGNKMYLTADEDALVLAIATRAAKTFMGLATLDVMMDVEACHLIGCKLDLEGLLAAPVSELAHDIGGIRRFLDRTSGELTQCFVPRYAAKYLTVVKTA